MAFCSKCGTEIIDGAKFCPKCGQPTNGNEANRVQEPEVEYSFDDSEEEEIKTWHKIVSVLVWPAGVILIIIALIKKQSSLAKSILTYTVIGIGIAIGLSVLRGGCSGNILQEIESTVSGDEYVDVEEVGYQDGYEMGFQIGDEETAKVAPPMYYSKRFGAPSTSEERELFKAYEKAFMRGFSEGRRAKN